MTEDYRGGHRPPEGAAPLHDLSAEGTFPRDVYEHPEWYSHGGNDYDRESASIVRRVKGKPSDRVTIYRSLPPDAEDLTFNRGEWVAISKAYATQHGLGRGYEKWVEPAVPGVFEEGEGWVKIEGDWPVIAAEVSVRDVRSGGNDIVEWGYWGPPVRGRIVTPFRRIGTTTAGIVTDYSDYVMVALRPTDEVAKVIADMDEYTEDPDEVHLTLLYLGTKEDCGGAWAEDRLYRGLYDFAINSGYRGLTAQMNGFGVFQNDDGDVLVSLWDIPGIAEFRTHLKRYLEDHGAKVRTDDHGFTPHMTMAYGEGKAFRSIPKVPSALRGEKVVFGSVWLVWGDEWTEVTLP